MKLTIKNIALCLVFITTFHAQTLEKQYAHADSLFNSKNYFDSVTEFKRLLFFDSTKTFTFLANYKIAESYKKGGFFENAVKHFNFAAQNKRTNEDYFNTRIQIVRIKILERQIPDAFDLLINLERSFFSDEMIKEIHYWKAWAYMFDEKWEEASIEFGKFEPNHELKVLTKNLGEKMYSPQTAKILSYFLPCAGQFYTGEYLSGLMSLAWTAFAGYLTIDAFTNNRVFDGAIVGDLLFLRFYSGNYNNAEKFAIEKNIKLSNELLRYLQNEYKGILP